MKIGKMVRLVKSQAVRRYRLIPISTYKGQNKVVSLDALNMNNDEWGEKGWLP